MQIGSAVEAGLEAGGRGLLAMREESDLSERTLQDAAAGRQAVLMIRIGIVVVHRRALDARGARVHRYALDAEQALLEADAIAGVADQLAAAADDAVAGHHDRQRIVT